MSFLFGLLFVAWGALSLVVVYVPTVRVLLEKYAPRVRRMLVSSAAGWAALAVGVFIWMPPPFKVDIFIAAVGLGAVLVLNAVRREGAPRMK